MKQEEFDINLISEEQLKKLDEEFYETDQIVELNAQKVRLMRAGKVVQSIQVGQKIEKIRRATYKTLWEESQEKVEQVNLMTLGLSTEELENISKYTVAMFMICDMLEFLSSDIDTILKSHDDKLHYELFDKMVGIGKAAKEQIRWLSQNTKLYQDIDWGNQCDDVFRIVVNKAGAIIRRNKQRQRYNDKKNKKDE